MTAVTSNNKVLLLVLDVELFIYSYMQPDKSPNFSKLTKVFLGISSAPNRHIVWCTFGV